MNEIVCDTDWFDYSRLQNKSTLLNKRTYLMDFFEN